MEVTQHKKYVSPFCGATSLKREGKIKTGKSVPYGRGDSMMGQGTCGFDKGRSSVVKVNVKSLTTPYLAKLDRKNWFYVQLSIDLVPPHMDSPEF